MTHAVPAPSNASDADSPRLARHFRQILLWPLQLIPLGPGTKAWQHHWEVLTRPGCSPVWQEVQDEFTGDPDEFQERHYREFVTFLPHVQRFLYGQGRSGANASATGYGESPMRVFRRADIKHIRLTFPDGEVLTMEVKHIDLYFFYEVDVALLAFEYWADDVPLSRVQDIGYRFGRVFPARWNSEDVPEQCMRNIEWLGEDGAVLMDSDFHLRQAFLSHACQHREARVGRHWDFLLRPMVQHDSDRAGEIRYRQLDYHHLPTLTYLAFDDPFELTREDFFRLGMSLEPDTGSGLPHPRAWIEQFERDACYDHYWDPERTSHRSSMRIVCTSRAMVMVGSARSAQYVDADTGMLGQFRHQYFLLGMIAHFHHAAFLMLSDRMVFAVSRLDVEDAESMERFRHHIRHTTETFLRFNHRYWFHEVSKQLVAKDLFQLWRRQLNNEELFQEVREEMLDMSQYLDTEASRRQNDVVLRLTVVTIVGLIGTIATGFLGMNLIDATAQPFGIKVLYFMGVLVPSIAVTVLTVVKSGRLAKLIDFMATDDNFSVRERLKRFGRVLRIPRARMPRALPVTRDMGDAEMSSET
jgi:hypothetical protein